MALSAPSKLPDEIAQKISAASTAALNDDAFRASLEKIGFPLLRPRSAGRDHRIHRCRSRTLVGRDKSTNISLD